MSASFYIPGELYSINDRARLLFVPPQYTIQVEGKDKNIQTEMDPDLTNNVERNHAF